MIVNLYILIVSHSVCVCSVQEEIIGVRTTCRPSPRTAMWATCPLCREPVAPLDSAARATYLSNRNGRKETARSGKADLQTNMAGQWTPYFDPWPLAWDGARKKYLMTSLLSTQYQYILGSLKPVMELA